MMESNRRIAEFVGYKKEGYLWIASLETLKMGLPKHAWDGDNSSSLKFHESWNWLMPVVEKIDDLGYECVIGADTFVAHPIWESSLYEDGSRLENTYAAVMEFIEHYDESEAGE